MVLVTSSIRAQFMEPHIVNNNGSMYTASFVAKWATDTASVETFTIIGNHLYGRAIHLYPEPHLRHFSYKYNDNGSIRDMDIQFFDLNNTSTPLDSKTGLPLRITMKSQNEIVDFRVLDKYGEKQFVHNVNRMDFFGGWTPIFGQWQWLTNLITKGKLGDNLQFLNYIIGDYDIQISKISDKQIQFKSEISAPITFYLDEEDRINKIDALGSPWNYTITRHEPIDLEKFTKSFAKKEIIGDPSPHDQFSTTIAECMITMDYGRPSKRGREIFGNVVPYNKVWRTGAGTPTLFTSGCDIEIQGKIIPHGTYNIFTIPTETTWKLIFNTEDNAWGSAYRKEYDFIQVEMISTHNKKTTEKLLIEIKEKENGDGEINMSWDNTTAQTTFKVLK